MRHTEIGAGSALAAMTFFDLHPFIVKLLSAVAIAIVSTVVSRIVERFLPRRKP